MTCPDALEPLAPHLTFASAPGICRRPDRPGRGGGNAAEMDYVTRDDLVGLPAILPLRPERLTDTTYALLPAGP